MKNIAFSHTSPQLLAGQKTVTRRMGWKNLKPGEILCAVRKSQGLKKGEKIQRLAIIEITDVREEPLKDLVRFYPNSEITREGFKGMHPIDFVDRFCKMNKCDTSAIVTRIEFKVLDFLENPERIPLGGVISVEFANDVREEKKKK